MARPKWVRRQPDHGDRAILAQDAQAIEGGGSEWRAIDWRVRVDAAGDDLFGHIDLFSHCRLRLQIGCLICNLHSTIYNQRSARASRASRSIWPRCESSCERPPTKRVIAL